MNILDAGLLSIEQANSRFLNNSRIIKEDDSSNDLSFGDILKQKTYESADVKFSKHANQRLESRNITLSQNQMTRLNQGVDRARNKNINEPLVMMDDLAFIVNVKNNTVVTAFEGSEDSVFTNIDGAVIV